MTLRLGTFLVLALSLTAVGCRGGGTPGPEPLAPFPAAVRVYYDNSGGLADSLRLAIRNEAEFHSVWQQATSRQFSPPPPPAIDFGQDMILVSGAGRLTSDDRIQVDSVGLSRETGPDGSAEETLNVYVSVILACPRFDIEGFPLEIVRIRRFDGPIRFHDRQRQADNCPGAGAPGGG